MLSVVIRGVDLDVTDTEAEQELQTEGHTIHKCIRIKTKEGMPSYMVRVLTPHQPTINSLLANGAYIYLKRHRVEPSRTSAPLPLRCEKCQSYNAHYPQHCPNEPKCGYCTGSHKTKDCTNLQFPPKCTTCGESHSTFSYKCKGRPQLEPDTPAYIAPLRLPEQSQQPPITSNQEPITVEQVLTLITLTL